MKHTMKHAILPAAVALLGVALLGAAEPQALYQEANTKLNVWKNTPKQGVIQVSFDTEKEPGTPLLKLDFKIDDPKTVYAWPQTIRKITPVPLDGEAVAAEFDIFADIRQGAPRLFFSPRPLANAKEQPVPVKAGEWTHVVVPVMPKKAGVALEGYGFHILGRAGKAGDDYSFYIKNFRLIRGGAAEAAAIAAARKTGILSSKVVPASSLPLDNRLEIMIPNLLVNGYFREGGDMLPPHGWGSSWGGEVYGKGLHDGRTVKLAGRDDVKTLSLRQNGLVLVPGEPYRLSGYIRGGGFTGPMQGHIVVACPRWSKTRGYNFTDKDIKPEWQYFEVTLTPEVSTSGEYEAIIYRTGAGGGWIEVDRLILEPLSEKAVAGSRNKYTNDKFSENYAKAKKEGTLHAGPPSRDYELVWSDEFDGDKVDTSKWKVYEMYTRGERPYRYVPAAAKLDGKGHLLLTTSLAPDHKIETARLSTTGRATFVYGYIECGFKLHDTPLANASFWMLPEGPMDVRDPVHKGMEIDIMECVQPHRDTISHTTHWYSKVDGVRVSHSGGTRGRMAPGLHEGFHTVALEWTPTDLIFYIDGVESWRLNEKDHPIPVKDHNIILSFGGRNKEILARDKFSAAFTIDYVRVYQKKGGAGKLLLHGAK